MRLSHSLLLASVAVLTLPSCSSAQGPGAVGSKNDIIVRNHGEAPLPPPAADLAAASAGQSEALLQQEASAASADLMATRGAVHETVQDAQRAGDQVLADAEQEALAVQQQAQQVQEVQQARQFGAPAAQQPVPQMEAVPAPAVIQHNQAPAQPVPAPPAEAVPVPSPELVQSPAAHVDSSLATRPATTVAGQEPSLSPEVDAGLETRTGADAVSSAPAPETAVVVSPPVEQAATEFQDQPVDQAAQRALANPPTPVATGPEGERPAPAPAAGHVPVPAQSAQQAAPVARPVTSAGRYVPTPAEIAAGGVRVVTSDGEIIDHTAPALETPSAQPQPPVQQQPAAAQAPAPITAPAQPAIVDGKPVLDSAMIARAQTILAEKGYYTGLPNGEMSTQFLNALSRYQSANFLTPGGMTVETAKHIGLIE